jgi:hypothetical protein
MHFLGLTLLVLLVASFAIGQVMKDPATPPPQSTRLTVFISDLHLGVGRSPQNPDRWHPMEDFRWLNGFVLFLKEIDRLGGGKADLVLNGDTFELWQSLKGDCKYDNPNLGCTEQEALGRIQRVLASHTSELNALAAFAQAKDNRLIIIPGNHDAALLFPRVRETVLQAIPAPGKVTIHVAGFWLSPDGLVYAEHGHQIGKEVNKWERWPEPFIENGGRKHLQRPWGERFVQEYYNQFEVKYPIIDNISVEGEGVSYARAAEGKAGTVADVAGFVNFFLFKVSSHQFASVLGDKKGSPPEWDVERIRNEGDRFMVNSLPTDHPFFDDAKEALSKGELMKSFNDLSEKDIVAICDERAALVKLQTQMQSDKSPTITECLRKDATLGAIAENILRSRDAILTEHLEKTCLKLSGCHDRPFKVFVYSHTHLAVPGFSPRKGDWQPMVVNTGAWQRVITPEQLTAKKEKLGLKEKQVLLRLMPEDLPECYSVILVKAYPRDDGPSPSLQYWTKTNGAGWSLADQCAP